MVEQDKDALQADRLISSVIMSAVIHSLTDESFKNFLGLANIPKYRFTPSSSLDEELLSAALRLNSRKVSEELIDIACRDRSGLFHFFGVIETLLPSDMSTAADYADHLNKEIAELRFFGANDRFVDFVTTISAHECLGFLESTYKMHHLPFDLDDRAEDVLKRALAHNNVAEVIGLLWSSVKSCLAKLRSGRMSEFCAAEAVLPNFERLLIRARKESWLLTPYRRSVYIPQSRLSRIVFGDVIQISDDGYSFSVDWFKQQFL